MASDADNPLRDVERIQAQQQETLLAHGAQLERLALDLARAVRLMEERNRAQEGIIARLKRWLGLT